MTICILGRQPSIGLAELESLFGADSISVIADGIAQVDAPIESVARQELGGTIKIARLLGEIPSTQWSELIVYCKKTMPEQIASLPEGKLKLGLSAYGISVNSKSMENGSLSLKKVIKANGRSIRIIPNSSGPSLNSAQVLHNKLTSELGMELLFIRSGSKTILAQTVQVQDIEKYAFRDRSRPKRDAFVGMLPPKLAQIMIHLAVADTAQDSKESDFAHKRILDPFCGSGVVLQEAALFHYSVYGTDLSEKMVRYSRDNLKWLQDTHRIHFNWQLEVADAQDATWQQPIDNIVCETYLGQPLSGLPSREKLEEIIHGCNKITRNFLKNLSGQVQSDSRHCVAVPAWRVKDDFKHLPILRELEDLGFERVILTHATQSELIYYREDQIVARELLILTKK